MRKQANVVSTTFADSVVSLARRIASFLLWTVISIVVSYVASTWLQTYLLDGGKANSHHSSSHEAAIETCIIDPQTIDVGISDVGGLGAIKEELFYSLLLPLRYPRTFFRSNGSSPVAASRGILLCGQPGTGKTMLMRAIARECKCCLICPTLASLQNKYYGESQKLLSALFDVARKRAPTIIFIDEIDAAFRTRSDEDQACDYGFKTEFLGQMDGMRTHGDDAVVVVGACNHPSSLDPALRRRLSTVLQVQLPNAEERRHIVRLACRADDDRSADAFAELCDEESDGFSGAELAESYREACRQRIRRRLTQQAGIGDESGASPEQLLALVTSSSSTLMPDFDSMPALDSETWRSALNKVREGKGKQTSSICAKECKTDVHTGPHTAEQAAVAKRVADAIEALKT